MKRLIIFGCLAILAQPAFAQKFFSRDLAVYFNATSPTSPEKIEAVHQSGVLVLDAATGNLESSILVKGFFFEQALMQEHFNENYMESSKFPKATFKGKIENLPAINFSQSGKYTAKVVGNMTMHGVTKPISTTATIETGKDKIEVAANFEILLADFGITIPRIVGDKVAEKAALSVKGSLGKMNQ